MNGELYSEGELGQTNVSQPMKPLPEMTQSDKTIAEVIEQLPTLDNSRFTEQSCLGQGGGGVVSEYYDSSISRSIAVKTLDDENSSNKRRVNFVKEALLTATLQHPSIIPIYEIANDKAGAPIYLMKKLDGTSLNEILCNISKGNQEYCERYPLTELIQIYLKVCDAVAYAHSQHILHLDIKPDNIMIGEFGDVLLMDWGIAHHFGDTYRNDTIKRVFETTESATPLTIIKGTPGYMSPEQASGNTELFDERTDIHALGALLYSILTHRRPYIGLSHNEIIESTIKGNVASPQRFAPHLTIPKELSDITMKAMSTRKENRYQYVLNIKKDINSFLLGTATTATKETLSRKAGRFYTHKTSLCNTLAILFAALVTISFMLHDYHEKTHGSWREIVNIDFSDKEQIEKAAYLSNARNFTIYKIDDNNLTDKGFFLRRKMLYIGQPGMLKSFPGDIKIELDFEWTNPRTIDALEICFNSDLVDGTSWTQVPKGYSVQIASWLKQYNYLSLNQEIGVPNILNSTTFKMPKTKRNQLKIERYNKTISVYLNNKKILTDTDSEEFFRRPFDKIRLQTWDDNLLLHSLKISCEQRAALTSPLDVGDSFLERRNYKEAQYEYLRVTYEFDDDKIIEEATLKYLQALYYEFQEQGLSYQEFEKRRVDALKKCSTDEVIVYDTSREVIRLWNDDKQAEALGLIETLQNDTHKSTLAMTLLREHHSPLSSQDGQLLLQLIALNDDIRSLDISNLGLTSIAPLRNLKLEILNCSNNNISDIKILRDMPLSFINVSYTDIHDLSPLDHAPLKALIAISSPIKSLPKLSANTLEVCEISLTKIKSIDSLANQPLISTNLSHTAISSLAPLKNSTGLRNLYLNFTNISDLSPIKDIPLRKFWFRYNYDGTRNPVTAIDNLDFRNMHHLIIQGTNITTIPDLSASENISWLSLADNKLTDLSPLANVRGDHLSYLDVSYNPIKKWNPGIKKKVGWLSTDKIGSHISLSEIMSSIHPHQMPTLDLYNASIEEVQLLLNELKTNNYLENYQKELQKVIYFKQEDYEALRKAAIWTSKGKYTRLRMTLPYDKAKNLAEKCGGTLVCFETKEEFEEFKKSSDLFFSYPGFYTGLSRDGHGNLSWSSQQPVNWMPAPFSGASITNTYTEAILPYYYFRGSRFKNNAEKDLAVVIEFPQELLDDEL